MPILSHPSFGPRTALGYVTGGALLCVWSLVWYFTRERGLEGNERFWFAGLLLTGITFVFLGLVLAALEELRHPVLRFAAVCARGGWDVRVDRAHRARTHGGSRLDAR